MAIYQESFQLLSLGKRQSEMETPVTVECGKTKASVSILTASVLKQPGAERHSAAHLQRQGSPTLKAGCLGS